MQIYCRDCGSPTNNIVAKFCPECGKPFISTAKVPPKLPPKKVEEVDTTEVETQEVFNIPDTHTEGFGVTIVEGLAGINRQSIGALRQHKSKVCEGQRPPTKLSKETILDELKKEGGKTKVHIYE